MAALGNPRRTLGLWGHLAFLLWTLALATLAPGAKVIPVLGLAVAFSALCAGWREVRRWRLWLFAASVLLVTSFVREKDLYLLGLGTSAEGFWLGLWMALRAASIALVANTFAGTVSVVEMARLCEGWGLRGLGFAVGVAFNMLPTIRETAEEAFNAMRLRGGFKCHRLEALKMLLVAIVAGSLRHGDEIVSAAEARAFNPESGNGEPVRPTPFDLAFIAVLVTVGLAILAW